MRHPHRVFGTSNYCRRCQQPCFVADRRPRRALAVSAAEKRDYEAVFWVCQAGGEVTAGRLPDTALPRRSAWQTATSHPAPRFFYPARQTRKFTTREPPCPACASPPCVPWLSSKKRLLSTTCRAHLRENPRCLCCEEQNYSTAFLTRASRSARKTHPNLAKTPTCRLRP